MTSEVSDEVLFGKVRETALAAGGLYYNLSNHVLAMIPHGNRRLVVTFDNLAGKRETEDRFPWGYGFLTSEGWDVMGVMSKQADWFRRADLKDLFDALKADGVFAQYDHVAFYGASMGAFGALAFAPVAPGCTVVAMAPQSTLNRVLVPFESRYRYGRGLGDWEETRYRDGVDGVKAAGKVYVIFDPWEELDLAHAKRLTGPNVTFLKLPGSGHKIPPALAKMGILKPVALGALSAELSAVNFSQLYRARRKSVPWVEALLTRAQNKGHLKLALRAGETALADLPNWKIRHQVKALRQALRG